MAPRIYTALLRLLPTLALVVALTIPMVSAFANGDGCEAVITVDHPTAYATVQGGTVLAGWAVDQAVAYGNESGIYEVQVYLDDETDVGQVVAVDRPDVDAVFGLSEAAAGWVLFADLSDADEGSHMLSVHALTGCGWSALTVPIEIREDVAEIYVDTLEIGDDEQLILTGWAVDSSGPGPGIDLLHISVGGLGDYGTMLGAAAYGLPRADVARVTGRADWSQSGYQFVGRMAGLPPGPHTLYIAARSSLTGQWTYTTVNVNVSTGSWSGPAGGRGTAYGRTAQRYLTTPIYGDNPANFCAPGTIYNNGQCIYVATPNAYCPPGMVMVGGTCASASIVTCGPGYAYSGGGCTYVGGTTVSCPVGYTPQNGSCLVTSTGAVNCGPGYVYSGGQCLSVGRTTYSCPTGYVLQNNTCLAASTTTVNCGMGYLYSGGQCVYVGTATNLCQAGYVYQNGSCTYTGGGLINCGGYYVNPAVNPYC